MPDTAAQAQMEDQAVKRIAQISTTIREAVRAALPAPPEQFMTVMIPGKVVRYEDYMVDEDPNSLIPLRVELQQAMLCDDMPALASVQLGPTGRSVARSYATAISKLIPAGTTIGIDSGSGKILSEDQKRYKQAMAILSSEVPSKDGHTLVEIYTIKQKAYTDAVSAKTKAFSEAMKIAQSDPANKTPGDIRAAYDRWVQENAKAYRNAVQATYMDWVIMGKKEEVEYWFSVVDQDSALARVEQSKETMRWAVVQDSDGSGEFQKVVLEPKDWANKCKKKASSGSNQTKTAEWYTWEITRLEKQNQMLGVLKANPPTLDLGSGDGEESQEEKDAKEAFEAAMAEAIKCETAVQANPPVSAKEPKIEEEKAVWNKKKEARATATTNAKSAQEKLRDAREKYDKAKVDGLATVNKKAQNELFKRITADDGFVEKTVQSNNELIETYKAAMASSNTGDSAAGALIDRISSDMGMERAPPPKGAENGAAVDEDFFTPITCEVTASSDTQSSSESSSSLSFGASASYGGWFSASGSVSHSESNSHAEAMSELVSSSVKISFECMRVDIARPWLRPELFYDEDLVIGPSSPHLSPGFGRMRQLLEAKAYDGDDAKRKNEEEISRYSTFPMYPTAFLVACNVVLEISGSTSKLQTMFNSSASSSSASVSVGYGPFSASANVSTSKSSKESSSKCEATASGCRITIKSPQIIGWISQMVPALPRLSDDASKSQKA